MSIIPAGSTGYADYQRNVAADGSVLASYDGYVNSQYESVAIPVGQYWGTSTVIQTTDVAADYVFSWTTAATSGNEIGSRYVYHSGQASNYAPLVVPNLGPYLFIYVQSPTATYPLPINFYTAATNRSSSILTPAPPDLLINEVNADVGGGSTGYFYPTQAYAGPAQMWTYSSASSAYVIQVWNGVSWIETLGYAQAEGTNVTTNITLPLSSWRIACINYSSAAAGFDCAITPAFTGSS